MELPGAPDDDDDDNDNDDNNQTGEPERQNPRNNNTPTPPNTVISETSHSKREERIRRPRAKEVAEWDGSGKKLNLFLRDLTIHFAAYQEFFRSDKQKILAALNRTTGRAENWATQLVLKLGNDEYDPRIASWAEFQKTLQQTFGEKRKKDTSQKALLRMKQLSGESVLSFRLRLEEVASWSGFNDDGIFAVAKNGINSSNAQTSQKTHKSGDPSFKGSWAPPTPYIVASSTVWAVVSPAYPKSVS